MIFVIRVQVHFYLTHFRKSYSHHYLPFTAKNTVISLIFWCGNFVEGHSRGARNHTEIVPFHKIPLQEIRLNYGIFRSGCWTLSPSQISDMQQEQYEPGENLSSRFVKISYAVMITTTPQRHDAALNFDSKHPMIGCLNIKVNIKVSPLQFFYIHYCTFTLFLPQCTKLDF